MARILLDRWDQTGQLAARVAPGLTAALEGHFHTAEEHRIMVSWQAWKNRFMGALFVGFVSTQAMAQVPTLSLTASPAVPAPGSLVTLSVRITGALDVFAYQFSLGFNPAVLQAAGGSQGSFLSAIGSTSFGSGLINNTTGLVDVVYGSLFGTGPGASGNGVLATLTFNVISAGTSPLVFSDVVFLNSALSTLSIQAINSTLVSAVSEPTAALLFGAGLVGIGALQLRRTQSRRA